MDDVWLCQLDDIETRFHHHPWAQADDMCGLMCTGHSSETMCTLWKQQTGHMLLLAGVSEAGASLLFLPTLSQHQLCIPQRLRQGFDKAKMGSLCAEAKALYANANPVFAFVACLSN